MVGRRTLRLWDAATGAPIGPAMRHDGSVGGALFSRDESRILSWSADRTLRLWDAATGAQIGPAMRHDDSVTGALFSRDESRILSWSADGRCGCGTRHGAAAISLRSPAIVCRKPMTSHDSPGAMVFASLIPSVRRQAIFRFPIGKRLSERPDKIQITTARSLQARSITYLSSICAFPNVYLINHRRR